MKHKMRIKDLVIVLIMGLALVAADGTLITTPTPSSSTVKPNTIIAAAAASSSTGTITSTIPPTNAISPTSKTSASTTITSTVSTTLSASETSSEATTESEGSTTTDIPAVTSTINSSNTSPIFSSSSSITGTQSSTVSISTVATGPATTPAATTPGTIASTSLKQSTSVPTLPSTNTATTATTTVTTTAPPEPVFLINEFTYSGLFAAGKQFFIEVLRMSGPTDTSNVTIVIWNGIGLTCEEVVKLDQNWTASGLQVKNLTLQNKVEVGLAVGLYLDVDWKDCAGLKNVTNHAKLQDVMILSKGVDLVNGSSFSSLQNNIFNVLVADQNKFKNVNTLSVSRCDNTTNNPGSFIISAETRGSPNQCSMKFNVLVKMTLNSTNCDLLNNTATVTALKKYIAKTIGDKCLCGFSPFLVQKNQFECAHFTYTWNLLANTSSQKENVKNQYDVMVKTHTDEKDCFFANICPGKPCTDCGHHPTGNKSNIKVTIGVVVTCIVVFLIIVAIVIIYIRRKRRGILQFRMTRLDEDDDDLMIAPDTDDFIGGQDASFNNPTYSRFK